MTAQTVEELPIVRKHNWDLDTERRIAAAEFPDGNGRTIRVCKLCGLSRITVHPPHGYPWPEFLYPGAKLPFQCDHTPPCPGRK